MALGAAIVQIVYAEITREVGSIMQYLYLIYNYNYISIWDSAKKPRNRI